VACGGDPCGYFNIGLSKGQRISRCLAEIAMLMECDTFDGQDRTASKGTPEYS
jgi:hypothetical protein